MIPRVHLFDQKYSKNINIIKYKKYIHIQLKKFEYREHFHFFCNLFKKVQLSYIHYMQSKT